MKLLVNFHGAPGASKSALAAGLFAELKWAGVSCELVTEFAKDKVWEESIKSLDDQFYVFGEQMHRVNRLKNKVDIVITDSPSLNSIVYYAGQNENLFFSLVRAVERGFNSLDIFVKRAHNYESAERYHTEAQTEELDAAIATQLKILDKDPIIVHSSSATAKKLAAAIIASLKICDVQDIIKMFRLNQ